MVWADNALQRLAMLLVVAPTLALSPHADASALSPNADGSGAALCDACGHHNSAEPNCCSKGGSWEGLTVRLPNTRGMMVF